MASLADKLAEKHPAPVAQPRTNGERSGNDVFSLAGTIDTLSLLDRLGIAHTSTARGELAQCPGCGEEGALVCKNGGLKCLHDRCKDAGPVGHQGFRDNVAIVVAAKKLPVLDAAKYVCELFGIAIPKPVQRQTVQQSPTHQREPGDDADEKSAAPAKPSANVPRVLTVPEILNASVERAMSRDPVSTCTTCHHDLDRITGGLRPGFTWLIGADTSFGKSSWLIAMADDNIRRGKRVLIVSSEDTEEVYGDRLMVRRAKVDALRYRDRKMTREEMRRVLEQAKKAEPVPVYVDARRWPIEDLAPHLKTVIAKERIDVIAFDYVQEFRSKKRWQDERVKYREIASVCRHIAKDAKICGLIFSQLTLNDQTKTPTRLNIRECRDIANAAEVILIGYEVQETDGRKTKIAFVDKVKNGPRGARVELSWNTDLACFDTVADEQLEREQAQYANIYDDGSQDGSDAWWDQ